MSKTIFRFLGMTLLIPLLTGCVIVINNGKPTTAEQNLMDIQGAASQQISQLNQKIQSGNYSVSQIQDLIAQAKKVVDDNLKKIEGLEIPARAKDLEDKTKQYLLQAEQTYQSFLQMSAQTNEQVQQLIGNLKTMSQPLLTMAKQMEELKVQFLSQLQQAAASK